MKSKKPPNKRLSGKFVTCFFIPFLIGTILSMIMLLIMFPLASDIINSCESLTNIFVQKEFKRSLPLILSGIYSINNVFQLYINNLFKIKNYYKYNNERILTKATEDKKKFIINKFSFNGVNESQINNFKNLYIKNNKNKEYLMNQMKWFIDTNKKFLDNNNEDDKILINQTYTSIYLIPLLKTIIKLSNTYNENIESTNQIYIMFASTELFIKYPIIYNNINGNDLNIMNNPSNCKTKKGTFPEYYYFKCKPYYSFLLKEVEKDYNLSISNAYKLNNGNYGITICIQFYEETIFDVITICHDFDMSYINTQLDSLNNKLSGYLFLIKTKSEVPLYYPVQFKDYEYVNLANMEFSDTNEYYSDEISLFNNKIPLLIEEYSYINDSYNDIKSFDISKNNEKYKYSLFPIYFKIQEQKKPLHLMTLVYVNLYNKNYGAKYLYSTILIVIIYVLMECFLLLLCKYLIISIAKNIVMPIKVIKDLLEQDFEINTNNNNIINDERDKDFLYNNINKKMNDINNINNNTQNKNKNENNSQIKNDNIDINIKETNNIIKDGFDNNKIMEESNNNNKENQINKERNNMRLKLIVNDEDSSEDENSSFDNDDDIDKTKYRSNNIQQLFMKLVDLKNSFKCLENNKLSNDKLSNLVYAQNVFFDINNLEASSLCESNISSLFVNSNQFDKAISHLYNGIEDINRKIFNSNKKDYNKMNFDDLKKKIKSENLLNRYIKLFYCYKKYFKNVKKKYKNKNIIKKSKKKKDIFVPDINSFYITHHIKLYKKCLDDYIIKVKEYFGGKDLCLGLLEKLEERISFELNFYSDNNNDINYYNNINKADKEKIIIEICEIFKEVDKLNNNQISIDNYNVIHLINLLKFDSEIVNAMDIPPSILIQKTNFLKGKFHLKCYDYKQAIEYFEKTLDYGKIGDIEITIKALKYLIKIAKIYLQCVNNDIEFHSNENKKNKLELKEDNKRKELLNNFIINLTKEINSYVYIPKDICITINLGNLSKVNDLNINEKFSNIQKILKNIYEDITTNKDRIAILEYKSQNYKFFLNLQKKEEKINEIIDNMELNLYSCYSHFKQIDNKTLMKKNSLILQNKEKLENKNIKNKNSMCLYDSVKYCRGYLKKKQNNINNEIQNWIIFLTCGINDNEIDEIIEKPIDEALFPDKDKKDNLIIIFYENISDNSKAKLKKWIKFNKSDVLIKDELNKLKDIMGTKGEKQKVYFELEKYKDKF